MKHKRLVNISLVLPVSVELLVETEDDDPGSDSEWNIVEVRETRCEVTPRMVEEQMASVDLEALAEAAAKAKDCNG